MLLHTKKYLTVFLGKQDLDKLMYLHSEGKHVTVNIFTVFMGKIFIRLIYSRGLLPAGWQENFWSPASRLSLALKSPANRLAGDLKVSCQPDIGIL